MKRIRGLPRLLARSIGLVWQAARRPYLVTVVLNAVNGALLLAQLIVLKLILDRFLLIDAGQGVGILVGPLGAFVAILTIGGAIALVSAQLSWFVAELLARHAQSLVADAATRADLIDFERPAFHDRLERSLTDITERPYQLMQSLSGMTTSLFGTIAATIALLVINPTLAAISFVAVLPLLLVSMRAGRLTWQFEVDATENDRKREYLLSLMAGKQAAKEVRSFNLGRHLLADFRSLYDDRIQRQRALMRRQFRLTFVSRLVNAALLAGAAALVLWLVDDGQLSVSQAGTAVAALALLATRANGLVASLGSAYESGLFLNETFEFLDEHRAPATPASATAPVFEAVELRDVSFRYPSAGTDAVSHIDLEVRRGEVIALVGPNGSGKTTVAKLLAQLYRPTVGTTLWGSTDAASFDAAALREQIAVIFQDFEKYELPLRDNVTFGRLDAATDDDRVWRSMIDARIDEVVAALPQGVQTLLGPRWMGGTDLSVGQWQRLAIARAFFRDAPLLVLDEPTAAVDAQAEAETFAALRSFAAGRAVVVVSHRFSTVSTADRIYVFDAGRIIEHGSHGELIALDGTYARLFRLQASPYVNGG